jgi:hypothetical protein
MLRLMIFGQYLVAGGGLLLVLYIIFITCMIDRNSSQR